MLIMEETPAGIWALEGDNALKVISLEIYLATDFVWFDRLRSSNREWQQSADL